MLFACVHNAGRSQMAAALLDHHAEGRVDARSAGSAPADEINPAVRTVMAEIGIDLDGARPKLLTTDAVQASDVVVTMGCGDACPVFPGKRYLDWDLTDPRQDHRRCPTHPRRHRPPRPGPARRAGSRNLISRRSGSCASHGARRSGVSGSGSTTEDIDPAVADHGC